MYVINNHTEHYRNKRRRLEIIDLCLTHASLELRYEDIPRRKLPNGRKKSKSAHANYERIWNEYSGNILGKRWAEKLKFLDPPIKFEETLDLTLRYNELQARHLTTNHLFHGADDVPRNTLVEITHEEEEAPKNNPNEGRDSPILPLLISVDDDEEEEEETGGGTAYDGIGRRRRRNESEEEERTAGEGNTPSDT